MPDNPTSIPLSGAPPPGRIGHSHPASPAAASRGATARIPAKGATTRAGFGLGRNGDSKLFEGTLS